MVGRFLQEDTYRGDGLNLYAYCANNPVIYFDPSGHKPQYEDGGVQGFGNTRGNQAINGDGIGPQGVGNPVPVAGRGNTGRTVPNTLNEQMAMNQVQTNPLEAATKVPLEMNDSRWPASEGWVKMESVVKNADGTKTTIHYLYNQITGAFDDFKFKY